MSIAIIHLLSMKMTGWFSLTLWVKFNSLEPFATVKNNSCGSRRISRWETLTRTLNLSLKTNKMWKSKTKARVPFLRFVKFCPIGNICLRPQFPMHGNLESGDMDPDMNTHHPLPITPKSRWRWRKISLKCFKEIIISSRNKTLIGVMTLTDDLIGMGVVCVVPDGGRVRK